MKTNRRKYTAEFKAEICALVVSGQKTVPEVSEEHGLCVSGVYYWVRKAKTDAGGGKTGVASSNELEELRALRKENRKLKQERDFLVDAARPRLKKLARRPNHEIPGHQKEFSPLSRGDDVSSYKYFKVGFL